MRLSFTLLLLLNKWNALWKISKNIFNVECDLKYDHKYVFQEKSILNEDLTWTETEIYCFASLEINKLFKLFPLYKVCNCSDESPDTIFFNLRYYII